MQLNSNNRNAVASSWNLIIWKIIFECHFWFYSPIGGLKSAFFAGIMTYNGDNFFVIRLGTCFDNNVFYWLSNPFCSCELKGVTFRSMMYTIDTGLLIMTKQKHLMGEKKGFRTFFVTLFVRLFTRWPWNSSPVQFLQSEIVQEPHAYSERKQNI